MEGIFEQYQALISAVLRLEQKSQAGVEQRKAHLSLIDGSQLRINEVWIDGELIKYAYYRLTPTGVMLNGWDNAPHHAQLSTFPHHRHDSTGVHPSRIRSLTDVLDLLSAQLLPEDG